MKRFVSLFLVCHFILLWFLARRIVFHIIIKNNPMHAVTVLCRTATVYCIIKPFNGNNLLKESLKFLIRAPLSAG